MKALLIAAVSLVTLQSQAAEPEIYGDWMSYGCGDHPGCYREWFNSKTGEMYRGTNSPTPENLAAYQEQAKRDTEETLRFCLKQERGGVTSPSGIVCTGAFDPFLLRDGKSQFEPEIQKILDDNKKFNIGQ